ncbi:centromere protein T isoform X2 [Silurus asotus]|uniref:Centromere protein T isoform X2 n=1 Tax=Silurus asotus TaxID=30991 RepID=A0AAD5ACF3_SILAS|nr:centromere protein T isoform X2 [Silurus asotus]
MDSTEEEDLSARVLLRNVLHTETQRSPVTRSVSRDQRVSHVRRSSRLRNTPETPHVALRQKLKQKLHETAVLPSAPPSKRVRSEGKVLKTPAMHASPALYDDDITPRGLLRGIIQTEAEASLLLSGQTAIPQMDQQDINASIHSNRRSDGVSGLELPNLATEPLTHLIRGMSRRRPPPTFNVSAFEKQLDQPSGEEENDVSQENSDVTKDQDVSAGMKSVLSLSLKTPFMNIRSERAGLRRKAAGRRNQVSVDAFDEAVQQRLERHHKQDYTVVQDGKTLQDSDLHKFTLGLSNITVPELTTEVMMSNTELYAQPQTSMFELGGVTEAEMKIDVDDGGGDELQDHQNLCESNATKHQPDTLEDQEPISQSQELEDEIIPPSQENKTVTLSPEDIPFAPTQAMVEISCPPQESEESRSAIKEAQVEEIEQRESESLEEEEEEQSHLHQRITRRAYRSEGGAIRNGVVAKGRGTKSLGFGEEPTEEQVQSFAGGTEMEMEMEMEIVSMEEGTSSSDESSSPVHTTKPSASSTHQDSLVQNADEADGLQDLGQSEREEVIVSVGVSPTVDCPAAEEEEEVNEQVQQQQQEAEEEEEEDKEEQQQEEMIEHVEEQQQEEEEEEEDDKLDDEEEDAQSEGFIRHRKQVSTPSALATPTILKPLNAGPAQKVTKPRPKRGPRPASGSILPKSYVMSIFKHFAKTKVASDVYPVISDILQRYFDRLADDLEAYSAHAKRKTIEVEDVELLMRRQGFVTDSTPVNVLIEKFLPLEYRKLLIPVATSGNKVVPDKRR